MMKFLFKVICLSILFSSSVFAITCDASYEDKPFAKAMLVQFSGVVCMYEQNVEYFLEGDFIPLSSGWKKTSPEYVMESHYICTDSLTTNSAFKNR